MPSDPTGRHPIGVLARPAADFFDDNLATGGAVYQTDPPVGNTYATISLFNNSTTGQSLKVYGISVGNDDTGTAFAYFLQGTPLGTLQGPGFNVNSQLPTPFGQIFMRTDHVGSVTALYPLPLPGAPCIIGAPDAGSATIVSPFPLFIIAAGYSLAVANADSGSRVWAAFWWQVANE